MLRIEERLADWLCESGEVLVGGEDPNGIEDTTLLLVGEFIELRNGKEDDKVETGGTGKDGANEDETPRGEVRGSGRLLVRLRLGDPTMGFCLIFLSTFL